MRNASTTLRWLAVFPAAILAGWVTYYGFGLAGVVGAGFVGEEVAYSLRLLLFYAPKNAAFVIVGAAISPRPLPTAIVLAILSIALSLLIHILGQQSVGMTNYLHLTAESAGALLGIVFICIVAVLRKPSVPLSAG
jgi:hypothetical protein